ncbi:MAG: DUF4229 domain-containing protein [Nocardioidaceae bacterium]
MRTFVLYTLARLALFAATFGLIWLVFNRWLDWSTVSALYTAIIAMIVSSIVSLFVLGSLRDAFAVHVAERAERAKAAFEARRAAEDDDVVPDAPPRDGGASVRPRSLDGDGDDAAQQ